MASRGPAHASRCWQALFTSVASSKRSCAGTGAVSSTSVKRAPPPIGWCPKTRTTLPRPTPTCVVLCGTVPSSACTMAALPRKTCCGSPSDCPQDFRSRSPLCHMRRRRSSRAIRPWRRTRRNPQTLCAAAAFAQCEPRRQATLASNAASAPLLFDCLARSCVLDLKCDVTAQRGCVQLCLHCAPWNAMGHEQAMPCLRPPACLAQIRTCERTLPLAAMP